MIHGEQGEYNWTSLAALEQESKRHTIDCVQQNLVVFVGLFCDKPSWPVYNCKISFVDQQTFVLWFIVESVNVTVFEVIIPFQATVSLRIPLHFDRIPKSSTNSLSTGPPPNTNGWNLKIIQQWKGTWFEPNLQCSNHFFCLWGVEVTSRTKTKCQTVQQPAVYHCESL